MKKILLVLAFVSVICSGQENNVILKLQSGDISLFNSSALIFNSLDVDLMLKLQSSLISENNLTYNSSAQDVTYANADTVAINGNNDVVKGNYIRFENPASGTIYQIVNILGSPDSLILILNQTFAGNVTDEFLWGGVNVWHDESGNGNNAIQSTAVYQPKLLNDTSSTFCDGTNDYLYIPDADNLSFGNSITDNPFSISIWVKLKSLNAGTIIGKHTEDISEREYKVYTIGSEGELLFVLYNESGNAYIGKRNIFLSPYLGSWVNIIATYNGLGIDGMEIYINNIITTPNDISAGGYVAMENTGANVNIGGKASNSYIHGEIDDIYIYRKVLTDSEREVIYKHSKHYVE